MSDRHVVPNGVNGSTGGYVCPPVPVAEIAGMAREAGVRRRPVAVLGLPPGVDPRDLARTGWGVVFAKGASRSVRRALGELIRHRQAQAGARFRELTYVPGETAAAFLRRHHVGPGPADPDQLPYYLLLVGGPEEIPYSLQHLLDVQFAVGRIGFATPREYARYAQSVVAQDGRPPRRGRTLGVFSTQHPDDPVTELCATRLVWPLARRLRSMLPGWRLEADCRETATKERLAALLGGKETPDIVFTATHGLAFADGDPRQLGQQGAILCQGWEGPSRGHGQPISEDLFFAGEDLSGGAHLDGLLCFHLACFSAGTPALGSSFRLPGGGAPIAPNDFLAELPQRLLAHPAGGALAVIGHVDTVWECSLEWEGNGSQVQGFANALQSLAEGVPVGEAMKDFGSRYSQIAAFLVECLERERWGKGCSDEEIAAYWLATLDARSYVVLGDPAVRLAA